MGAYYFVNPLERVTFRGLQRFQLTFTCYLEDAIVSQVLSQVIGVCAVRGQTGFKWIVLISYSKDGATSCEHVFCTLTSIKNNTIP